MTNLWSFLRLSYYVKLYCKLINPLSWCRLLIDVTRREKPTPRCSYSHRVRVLWLYKWMMIFVWTQKTEFCSSIPVPLIGLSLVTQDNLFRPFFVLVKIFWRGLSYRTRYKCSTQLQKKLASDLRFWWVPCRLLCMDILWLARNVLLDICRFVRQDCWWNQDPFWVSKYTLSTKLCLGHFGDDLSWS